MNIQTTTVAKISDYELAEYVVSKQLAPKHLVSCEVRLNAEKIGGVIVEVKEVVIEKDPTTPPEPLTSGPYTARQTSEAFRLLMAHSAGSFGRWVNRNDDPDMSWVIPCLWHHEKQIRPKQTVSSPDADSHPEKDSVTRPAWPENTYH